MKKTIISSKKILITFVLCIVSFLLVSCKPDGVSTKLTYQNGQIGLVVNKNVNEVSYQNQKLSIYETHAEEIEIEYESYNLDNNYDNKIIVNDYEYPLQASSDTQNAFIKNKISILGQNIKSLDFKVTFKSGTNEFGEYDTFHVRNVAVIVDGNSFTDELYEPNEIVKLGSGQTKTNYRFNYQNEATFEIKFKESVLNAKGIILEDEKATYQMKIDNEDITLTNESFIDISININNDETINESKILNVNVTGSEIEKKIYLDNLEINNGFALETDAWAAGKHELYVVAKNKYNFIKTVTTNFQLGEIAVSDNDIEYQAYDPGIKEELDNDITKLGKEISDINNYEAKFSKISSINIKLKTDNSKRFVFRGKTLTNRVAYLEAYNHETQKYEIVSTSNHDENLNVQLGFSYDGKTKYIKDNYLYLRINSTNLESKREVVAKLFHATDTQYMVQKASKTGSLGLEAKKSLNEMADFIIDEYENSSLEYLMTTGDYVQTMDKENVEWPVVMENFINPLLESDVPFGVSSGNHDVGGLFENNPNGSNSLDDELVYDKFYDNLGSDVFTNKSWYGGTYKNNRSHYDYINILGHDFLFLYLGWGSSQRGLHVSSQDIDYAKTVLDANMDKTVVLLTHEYMGNKEKRAVTGEYVYENLVKHYSNIKFTFSGHINGTSARIDYLDDDNDGINDREVLQILTDLQEEESLFGASFIRMLDLDYKNNRIDFRLYSPFFNDYDIFVEGNPDYVKKFRTFTFDFDLEENGYGFVVTKVS